MEDVITEGQAEADTKRLTPGVISSYRHTWRQLWRYFFILLLYLLLTNAVLFLISYVSYEYIYKTWQLLIVSFATYILVTVPMGFGFYYITLRAARKEKVRMRNIFEPFRYYLDIVMAAIFLTLLAYIPSVVLGLVGEYIPILAFIIFFPLMLFAIIAYCKLAFIPFLVTDKGLNVFRAIKKSWNMTDGHAGKVFLIILLGLPLLIAANILLDHDVLLAGIICLVVGAIITVWMNLALAMLFHTIDTDPLASYRQSNGPSEYRVPGYDSSARDKDTFPTIGQQY